MIKAIKDQLDVRAVLTPIPKTILRLAMGERFKVLVDSFHLAANKIQDAGYQFAHPELETALADLLPADR